MTKITPPGTIKDALRVAVGILSLQVAAVTIGKSESYLYELGNQDSEKNISAKDAFALDLACLEQSGETPFTTTMRFMLDANARLKADDIAVDLLDAQVSLGALTDVATRARLIGGLSPQGRKKAYDFGMKLIGDIEAVLRGINIDHKKADKEAA